MPQVRKLLLFLFLFPSLGSVPAGCGAATTTSTATTRATATHPATATATATATAATIEGSAASCVGLSPGQQFAAARVVFVGRFLARIYATSPDRPYSTSVGIGIKRIPPRHPGRLGLS